MNKYVEEKRYRGKVQAIILDWSGTTADAYVVAPAVVFVEVFKRQNVEISMAEARGPMGLRKDLHIKALTEVNKSKNDGKMFMANILIKVMLIECLQILYLCNLIV